MKSGNNTFLISVDWIKKNFPNLHAISVSKYSLSVNNPANPNATLQLNLPHDDFKPEGRLNMPGTSFTYSSDTNGSKGKVTIFSRWQDDRSEKERKDVSWEDWVNDSLKKLSM